MKTETKTLDELRIEILEENIKRLDDVCGILKMQKPQRLFH